MKPMSSETLDWPCRMRDLRGKEACEQSIVSLHFLLLFFSSCSFSRLLYLIFFSPERILKLWKASISHGTGVVDQGDLTCHRRSEVIHCNPVDEKPHHNAL